MQGTGTSNPRWTFIPPLPPKGSPGVAWSCDGPRRDELKPSSSYLSFTSATAQLGSTTTFWTRERKITDTKDYFLETHIIWTSSQVREKHHGRSSFVGSVSDIARSSLPPSTPQPWRKWQWQSVHTQWVVCVCNTLFDKYIFKQSFGAWGPKFLDNEADVQSCSCSLREPGFRDRGRADC